MAASLVLFGCQATGPHDAPAPATAPTAPSAPSAPPAQFTPSPPVPSPAVPAPAQPAPSTVAPSRPAPSTATPAARPTAKPSSPTAAAPPKQAPSPPVASEPKAPPAPAAPKPSSLDLNGLEQRLKDTHAIGVFTKLSLKNQVDDLLSELRAFHKGAAKTPPSELRQKYDLLIMKVLSLLQNGDPQLASTIASSREALWGILMDPQKFANI